MIMNQNLMKLLDEAGESLPEVTHYLCLAVRSRGGTVTSDLLKAIGFYVNRRMECTPLGSSEVGAP